MKVKQAALYGKMDIRIREVELPPLKDDEILVKVIANGICHSTYKAAKAGADHIRIHNDVADHPALTGHEFSGIIEEVGKKWQKEYRKGQSCLLQAGIRYKGSEDAPGYSFPYFGGNTTYTIIPGGYVEAGALLTYEEDYYAFSALGEPISCVISGFKSNYHNYEEDWAIYDFKHGIKPGGTLALMAAGGPMGISAIDYAVHGPFHPNKIIVTEQNKERLQRAQQLIPKEEAKKLGIQLEYIDVTKLENEKEALLSYTDGKGFDDIIIFYPGKELVELGSSLLAHGGCMNFFAGPVDKNFSANINFYDVHYSKKHYCGNSGGNLDDIKDMMELSLAKKIIPEFMITHVAGLDFAPEIILHSPEIPGGKKLIYTHTNIPLMAMEDFRKHPEDEAFTKIADILEKNNMVWNKEAEKILLQYKSID